MLRISGQMDQQKICPPKCLCHIIKFAVKDSISQMENQPAAASTATTSKCKRTKKKISTANECKGIEKKKEKVDIYKLNDYLKGKCVEKDQSQISLSDEIPCDCVDNMIDYLKKIDVALSTNKNDSLQLHLTKGEALTKTKEMLTNEHKKTWRDYIRDAAGMKKSSINKHILIWEIVKGFSKFRLLSTKYAEFYKQRGGIQAMLKNEEIANQWR